MTSPKEWFRDAFQSDYSDLYAHRDQSEADALTRLIARAFDLPVGTRVLDCPCGAGRHLRSFEAQGWVAYGLDLSPQLLQQAGAAGSNRIARGDMRSVPYRAGTFHLLTNVFSSFGYFATDEENAEAFGEMVATVRPGGGVVLDFLNAPYVKKHLVPRSHRQLEDGSEVQEERQIVRGRVEKTTIITSGDGGRTQLFESVRLFEPAELELIFAWHRCEIIARFGSYEGAPLSGDSARCILMATRSAP